MSLDHGLTAMKAYLLTTCIIFGLITVAHVMRVVAEGMRLATDPTFVLLTLAAAALCFWGGRLLQTLQRSNRVNDMTGHVK
jgi:hypothetical protein